MSQPGKNNSEWPYSSLIIFGFFGPDSQAGKRLMMRSALGLILFIAGFIGTQLSESDIWVNASAGLIPISVLIIIYANTVYIKSLDSLEKLIQLTAFAAAYGAAIFIGFAIFAFFSVTGCYISPLWLLLAEPFRGMILFFTSRKYQ